MTASCRARSCTSTTTPSSVTASCSCARLRPAAMPGRGDGVADGGAARGPHRAAARRAGSSLLRGAAGARRPGAGNFGPQSGCAPADRRRPARDAAVSVRAADRAPPRQSGVLAVAARSPDRARDQGATSARCQCGHAALGGDGSALRRSGEPGGTRDCRTVGTRRPARVGRCAAGRRRRPRSREARGSQPRSRLACPRPPGRGASAARRGRVHAWGRGDRAPTS